jgi:16S rRNA processing protein RimM
MVAPETPDEWVWLARIRRAQGRKGEVFAEVLTDYPEKFADRRQLWLLEESVSGGLPRHTQARKGPGPVAVPSPRQVQLENHWLHKGGIVLHFAGVESISDAEALAGQIVAIPRSERAALAEDEVYIGDLMGCTLVDIAPPYAPVVVGTIENVEREAGPVPLLLVHGAAGEIMVPFAKSFLRKVDLDAKRVEMALPDGLMDLNVPEHP